MTDKDKEIQEAIKNLSDPMAFVEEYNKEMEEEANKMMKADPPATREFI